MKSNLCGNVNMKAAVYKRYGSPAELALVSLPIPVPKDAEVLVRVCSSTVNRTDCGFLRGRPLIVRLFSGLRKPKSTILGCEFSGEVIDIGPGVSDFTVGDRVCGFKDDDYGFGGHAEYTTVSVRGMITRIPEHMSYDEAAPALEGAHYALHYLRASGISKGQKVLVNGATGAIGSASVQLIKHLGGHVTAVCAGEHLEQVRALGADEVVDYQESDFTQLDRQFDVVFDAVGKSTFSRCKKILRAKGFYMSTELGAYWQNPFLALLSKFYGQKKVLFPLPKNTRADADYLGALLEKGQYKPIIDRSYSLDDIAVAFRYVEQGLKVGNVVIKIA